MREFERALDEHSARVGHQSRAAREMRSWWMSATPAEREAAGVPGSDLGEDVDPGEFLAAALRKFPDA